MILISFITNTFTPSAKAAICTDDAAAYSISALHRPSTDAWTARRLFYNDQKGSTAANSGYVGYALDGTSIKDVTDLWIELTNFTDLTKLKLATNQASAIPVRSKFKNVDGTDSTTKRTAFFYLTAPLATDVTNPQTFTITIYNGNPNLGGTAICTTTDGFSGTKGLLSTSANKVTSITPSASTVGLGSDFTVTALGETGTMGAGDDTDQVSGNGVFSISPAMAGSWDAAAFTFTGVSYVIDTNRNNSLADETISYNQLRYYPTTSANQIYRIVYYFTARKVAAATTLAPVQSIASGTQVKYTGAYAGAATGKTVTIVKNSINLNKAIKSITANPVAGANSPYDITYRLTLTNSGTSTTTVDYLRDVVTLNASGEGGGTYLTPAGAFTINNTGSITSLVASVSISTNTLTLILNGPITLNANQTKTIDYTIQIAYPTVNTSMPISNTATGFIGSETIQAVSGVSNVSINLKSTVTLTIKFSASGYVSVDALTTAGAACSTETMLVGDADKTCVYYAGTALTLTATSPGGSRITSWATVANGHASNTGNCAISNAESPCSMVINANATITPVFATSYTITVNGVSNVAVSDGASAFSCAGGTCTKSYSDGSTPALTFTPDSGYNISNITSDASGTTTATFNKAVNPATGTITLHANLIITVTVAASNYPLDVTVTGNSGLVTSTGGFITDCSYDGSGTCSSSVPSGTSVTLTITLGAGYTVTWSGDGCTGTALTCTVTMDQARSLVATVTLTPTPGAPVYVPTPPTITSISASEVCAIGEQITIKGTYLTYATVTVDGASARVITASWAELVVALPAAVSGNKTIRVTNSDGSASTTIKYTFVDRPEYVNFIYPETFQDRAFSYTFTATDAKSYSVIGTLPAGLTLNTATGEISGTPTVAGDYTFTIVANNICANAYLIVYMYVDKAIPATFTCSVAFNVPNSDNITEQKLINLKNCLSKAATLSPKYIDPVIFISGGIPAGLTPDQALTHPRYLPILDLIQSLNLNAQIYLGAFNGSTDSVQLNVYWPEPS